MLIILSKSPLAENHRSLPKIAKGLTKKGERVAVLHIQDACIAVTKEVYVDELVESKIDVYSLKADLKARELLRKTCKDVKLVDYKQLVDLLMGEHETIVSWTS